MSDRITFEEFAASRAGQLFKIAYLMCGDWHQAQDLVQIALSNLYPAWGRLTRGGRVSGLDAYARKTLLNCYISHRRLRRSSELPVGELPDRAAHGPSEESEVTLRLAVLAALDHLAPRNRAAVVLRYLEGYRLEEVADALGCSVNAVKSLNSRSLATLRELLGPDRFALLQN
ncbi:SigE family RNA polymerase sigma factor [Kitasatospora cineracea]|uniref:SigE family RNA polymerase sigma factor n=1 Tax=Kitasatospora TaxID=2063 RepID=UPI0004C435C0|nr:SigE family RNA polymerase sigma factor [Kitasatospora sp. NRRL B-11411]